jgi:Outer membrane protein beta-barrel domain
MRKTITFLLMLILLATKPAFAQIKVGICGGVNLATVAGQGLTGFNVNTRTGFHLGAIVEKPFSQTLNIQSGLLLSSKGAKIAGNAFTSEISPLYLEVPVNILYRERFGNNKFQLFAGPYLALGIAGKQKVTYLSSTTSNDIKFGTADDSNFTLTDFGLNVGAGIEIQRLLIRFQYGLSLLNLDPKGSDNEEIKHRVIGISMGYMLGN